MRVALIIHNSLSLKDKTMATIY